MFGSILSTSIALLALAGIAKCQQTGARYFDPVTGFTFWYVRFSISDWHTWNLHFRWRRLQLLRYSWVIYVLTWVSKYRRYVNGNYTFGLAFPKNVTTDFIGQLSVSSTEGWAGCSLGGTSKLHCASQIRRVYFITVYIVQNSLLIVAYPDGGNITTSLRQADAYSNPHLANNTDAAILPISSGTFVNETAYTITFLVSIFRDRVPFSLAFFWASWHAVLGLQVVVRISLLPGIWQFVFIRWLLTPKPVVQQLYSDGWAYILS